MKRELLFVTPTVKTQIDQFAKFRCGVTPIYIETGRYEDLDVDSRTYPI